MNTQPQPQYLIHNGKKYNRATRNWDWLPPRAHRTRDGKTALCGKGISAADLTYVHDNPTLAGRKATICAECRRLAKAVPDA